MDGHLPMLELVECSIVQDKPARTCSRGEPYEVPIDGCLVIKGHQSVFGLVVCGGKDGKVAMTCGHLKVRVGECVRGVGVSNQGLYKGCW